MTGSAAPGLTARQTPHHTCCLLRTTTPASLSPTCRAARLGARRPRLEPESARGERAGRRAQVGPAVGAPPRESGLATQPARGSAAWRSPPATAGSRSGASRPAGRGDGGGRRARAGGGAGPGRENRAPAGREGAAAAPSPRPGAEQQEAAQAAAGPAAARRPREAAEWAQERLSLGLGGWGWPGVAPRALTGWGDSRDPGAPGRTAEMPQTDTAAILETVSSGRGEGRRGGGTAAGGGERREGTAAGGGSRNSQGRRRRQEKEECGRVAVESRKSGAERRERPEGGAGQEGRAGCVGHVGWVQKAKAKLGGGLDGAGGQQLGAPSLLSHALRSGRSLGQRRGFSNATQRGGIEGRSLGGVDTAGPRTEIRKLD